MRRPAGAERRADSDWIELFGQFVALSEYTWTGPRTVTVLLLHIKVSPGSKQDCVVGWFGDVLKLRIQANPEKGKANSAVIELLSLVLQIPKDNVSIKSGHTSSRKVVQIDGLSAEDVQNRLPVYDA